MMTIANRNVQNHTNVRECGNEDFFLSRAAVRRASELDRRVESSLLVKSLLKGIGRSRCCAADQPVRPSLRGPKWLILSEISSLAETSG